MGGFLSEAQRASLDEALAQKAQENAVKEREVAHKQKSDALKARGSAGLAKEPKKGGAGGRFTWGSIMTNGAKADRAIDKRDPNYDSDEERGVVMSTQHQRFKSAVQQYKEKVETIVAEYFASGDVPEVAASIEDLEAPLYMHYFVKRLLSRAMDRSNREREMASVCLSNLYADVIPPEQMVKGFVNLADSIGDLVLDVPDAADMLAMFIARAVVDDVLPPAIVHRVPAKPTTTITSTTVNSHDLKGKLEQLLSARHGAEKVLRCWGSGAGLTYQGTKDSIARMLEEFTISRDVEEAARCLRDLKMPFFMHEVVKQAVQRAMEASGPNPGLAQNLVTLIVCLASSGEISSGQVIKGLSRVNAQLADLCLDVPAARGQHSKVMEMVREGGLEEEVEEGLQERQESVDAASITSTNGTAHSEQSGVTSAHSVPAFKEQGQSIIREFFASSDAGEVGRRLQELEDPGLLQVFVKQLLVAALNRKDREREQVSQLLVQLHPNVLSTEQLTLGFTRLLHAADDLVLDIPDAVHLLALFLGRAIVDEILPPAALTQVLKALNSDSLGVNVVKTAGNLLSVRHGAERLQASWKGGAQTLAQVRDQIRTIVDEFTSSRDTDEAARCLAELNHAAYHHEVVKAAIERVFADEKSEADILRLLSSLSATNVITEDQMTKGFMRVRSSLEDEALDYGPKSKDVYLRLVQAGCKVGWLSLDPEV